MSVSPLGKAVTLADANESGRISPQPRVTFVISALVTGGAQRVMSLMANYWAKEGWTITIVTLDDGQQAPFYELDPRVALRPQALAGDSKNLLQGLLRNGQRLLRLRHAIVGTHPHIVISFIDQINVLVLLSTLGTRIPIVVSERIDPHVGTIGKAWELLRRILYPRASRLIVQSERAARYFSPSVQKKCRVIPNPISQMQVTGVAAGKTDDRATGTIIAMGRLREQKGFDLLLRAFAPIARDFPEWSLQIWGEGASRSDLEVLRDELGLREQVYLPGTTQQPFEQMSQADLFVLSSRYEGFPNVLCEAMACGLPVISFDCPSGPSEIIRDGIDGILVANGDILALAAAMRRLMESFKERQRLAARATEVTQRFGIDRVMGIWEAELQEISG